MVAGLGVEDEALKIEITITSNHEAAIVSQAQQTKQSDIVMPCKNTIKSQF